MTPESLQTWLDGYVAAWRSRRPADIGALFTEDATYAFHPWDTGDEVVRGRDAIVASWLEEDPEGPDGRRDFAADYRPGLVVGDSATAVGTTRYTDGPVFWNVFQLRFVGDRCAEFVEWYMQEPATGPAEPAPS